MSHFSRTDDNIRPAQVFPDGWLPQGDARARDATVRFGIEKIGNCLVAPGVVACHDVYRAASAGKARTGYTDFMLDFDYLEEETGWSLPPELRYHSQIADQYRLECTAWRSGGYERCQFIAQYDVYLVEFHTYMSPEMMTYGDLGMFCRISIAEWLRAWVDR